MPLRVLHVVDSLAGSGGAENRMVDEVLALRDTFEQALVRLFERDFLERRLVEAGIPVHHLGFQARYAARTFFLAARRLRTIIRDFRPDVVHTTLVTGNLVGQLAARPLRIPVVSTMTRTGDQQLRRLHLPSAATLKGRLLDAYGNHVARSAGVRYRAVSEYARDTNCVSMRFPRERVTVIPRGVALEASPPTTHRRSDFGLPETGPLFVNVARLVPEKAQDLLVEAFAQVIPSLPDAHLAIAGDTGPAAPAVHAAVDDCGVAGRVHLLGFRADVRALVRLADVFVFSSLSEGFPGAVAEAMLVGTPVVAFDIPPLLELTDNGRFGRLARAGSAHDLAAAVLAEYRDPNRVPRAAAAQAHAGIFRIEAVTARLGELLATASRA